MTTPSIGNSCPEADLKTPRIEEQAAREMLRAFIDGSLIANNPDPPDFILCRNGSVVGWLEVTTARDPARAELSTALRRHGDSFETDQLEFDWSLGLKKTARIKDIDRDRLVRALILEERIAERQAFSQKSRRVQMVVARQDFADTKEISSIYARYGIKLAYPEDRRSKSKTSIVTFGPMAMVSSADPSLINELAEAKAAEKEEALADRDGETHLCVVVHYDEPTGAAMVISGGFEPQVPETRPNLPRWVTDVWMTATRDRLWHFSTSKGQWEALA